MHKQLFEDALLYKEDAYCQRQNVALGIQNPYHASSKLSVEFNGPSFEMNSPGLKWPRHGSWARYSHHFYCMLPSSCYHGYYCSNKTACRLTTNLHYLFDDSIPVHDYVIIDALVRNPATALLDRPNNTGIDLVAYTSRQLACFN